MSLIPFTAQPSRAVWPRLLKGGQAAPSLVSPPLLGPPGNKEKKDVKCSGRQELEILAPVKMDFCNKCAILALNKTKTSDIPPYHPVYKDADSW